MRARRPGQRPHPRQGPAAERIGAEPERCVFVDDLRENCAGAEAVGMTAIRHREPAETILLLEKLFGVPLQETA